VAIAPCDSPWSRIGTARRGNVLLLQGEGECVPCLFEGCDRHTASFSRCLQELATPRVVKAAMAMLDEGRPVCENSPTANNTP
jgi:heptosyltransferase-3